MADFFKNLKANELISAIICMALGIVLIIWPGTSVKVACMILGGALLLYGVLQIILYLLQRKGRSICRACSCLESCWQ